jgi:hypothetical protein
MLAKERHAKELRRQEAVGYVRSPGSRASADQDGSMRYRTIRAALEEPSSKSAGHRDVDQNLVATCRDL